MITSLQNPLVKQLRKLHRAKERRDQQVFLIEGTHLIEAAITAQERLAVVCASEDWQLKHPDFWPVIVDRAERVEIVSPEVLSAIATTVEPDGVVATIPRRSQGEFVSPSLGLMLETIQDPGNLGTMIRTAAAAGADQLWLSGDSVDLDHPKVLRASAGQWFRMPMRVCDDLKADILACQKQQVQVIATLPTAQLSFWELDWQPRSLILLGNEGAGLSPELAALADIQVRIPVQAGVESLNVAIAAALLLYEAQRQRRSRSV
jgi:RNA methyltransferase, TrmH family